MAGAVLDSIGWTYMGIGIAWTVVLACGMVYLYRHRHLPSIRMRRLPLLFTGIILLHAYAFICFIAYVIGPILPCSALFWMMNIWLPSGIAIFQAANSQYFHVASRQKQYAHGGPLYQHEPLQQEQEERPASGRWKRLFRGVESPNAIDRTLGYIGIGLFVQLLLSLLIFFGSKKFHPAYGLWDVDVHGTDAMATQKCAVGWEWWLSIVWQFFWAWIYAPYLLWKFRGIKDAHDWRLQTIYCCLAGLPASPLWLAGLYAPQMAPLDAYFWPPTWFSVSIFFMEVAAIGFPIIQIFKSNALRQDTLEAIASWEKRQQVDESSESTLAGSEFSLRSGDASTLKPKGFQASDTGIPRKTSLDSQKSDMFTMAALENALRTNPVPLLKFAALKDFSGENVSFLTHHADWRREWLLPKSSITEQRRDQFVVATRIYAHFVSLEFSEFPINISSKEMKSLHTIFADAAMLLMRNGSVASDHTDSATPFDNDNTNFMPSDSDSMTDLQTGVNLDTLGRANLRCVSRMQNPRQEALADVTIPEAFTEVVFENAEREIKYLVLTNTWPKFVHAGVESRETEEGLEEGGRAGWIGRAFLCA